MDTIDIGWWNLVLGVSIIVVPVLIFWYYRTNLVSGTLISAGRMIVQLLLVGFYLEFLFRLNNPWLNVGWLFVMLGISVATILNRTGLRFKYFVFPNAVALFFSILLVDVFFLLLIVRLTTAFDARYLIPITGMIMGNAMQNTVIALDDYFTEIQKNRVLFRFALANGASLHEAVFPFMQQALKKSLNPSIAKMAVIGLIALPGTMTGQIIGGSSPTTAIKYQIMLMLVIFASSALSVFISLILSNRTAFDEFNNLRSDIFTGKHQKKKEKKQT